MFSAFKRTMEASGSEALLFAAARWILKLVNPRFLPFMEVFRFADNSDDAR
jgi:hypothetical protein